MNKLESAVMGIIEQLSQSVSEEAILFNNRRNEFPAYTFKKYGVEINIFTKEGGGIGLDYSYEHIRELAKKKINEEQGV